MSEQQFDIIFRGDIVLGHQLADVKLRLQQLFKTDSAKVDALFSGRPTPLKRGLDEVNAQKYREVLTKAGVQVEIVVSGSVKPAAAPAPRPQAAVASTANQIPLSAAQSAGAQIPASAQTPAPVVATGWTLAPVGAILMQASEKPVVTPLVIDTSAISLRPGGGNILDASEQPKAPTVTVVAPNFEVAEAGTDLISAEERMELPYVEIELEDWTIAEAGEDLISASERNISPAPVIQIPELGLAPAGADLGQLRPKITPVAPDISGLRLAE